MKRNVEHLEEILGMIKDPVVKFEQEIEHYSRLVSELNSRITTSAGNYAMHLIETQGDVRTFEMTLRHIRRGRRDLLIQYLAKAENLFLRAENESDLDFTKTRDLVEILAPEEREEEGECQKSPEFERFDRLLTISNILSGHRWYNREVTEDHLDAAWQIAKKYFDNTGDFHILSRIVDRDDFMEKYSSDEVAKEVAYKKSLKELQQGISHVGRLATRANKFGLDLGITAKKAYIGLLASGKIARAEELKEGLNLDVNEKHYAVARNSILRRITDMANQGRIDSALKKRQYLDIFDRFCEKGLDLDAIPQVLIPEGFSGKITMMEFKDRMYLWADVEREGYHKDIKQNFERQLEMNGFDPIEVRECGGAHIRFKDDGSILVHDRSVDFGECDKEKAVEMVKSLYKDREVIGRPCERW